MKIVIDIPDVVKQRLDEGHIQNGSIMSWALLDMIKNGQVLPKGHGDLIDANALKKKIYEVQYTQAFCIEHQIDYSISMQMIGLVINNAPTVVEADKENKE